MDDSKNISHEAVHHIDDNDPYTEHSENTTAPNRDNQNYKVQNVICFWTIGLCNGFGWTVIFELFFLWNDYRAIIPVYIIFR